MEFSVATAVDGDVEYYRKQIRSNGTLPRMEQASAVVTVAAPVYKKGKGKSPETTARFKIMNEFADFSAKSVSVMAQAAWWILFRETKPNGLAKMSFNQLAEAIGKKRRATIYAIQELEKTGLLTVVRRGSLKAGASIYRVHGTAKRETT